MHFNHLLPIPKGSDYASAVTQAEALVNQSELHPSSLVNLALAFLAHHDATKQPLVTFKEAAVDLWETPADARCILTNGEVKSNGEAVMGKGVAKEASDRYPGLAKHLGKKLREDGSRTRVLTKVCPIDGPMWRLAAFPTKTLWSEPATLSLIELSTQQLVALADEHGWKNVVIPRPGCGEGGLDWESQVKPLLQEYFDDRFTVVRK